MNFLPLGFVVFYFILTVAIVKRGSSKDQDDTLTSLDAILYKNDSVDNLILPVSNPYVTEPKKFNGELDFKCGITFDPEEDMYVMIIEEPNCTVGLASNPVIKLKRNKTIVVSEINYILVTKGKTRQKICRSISNNVCNVADYMNTRIDNLILVHIMIQLQCNVKVPNKSAYVLFNFKATSTDSTKNTLQHGNNDLKCVVIAQMTSRTQKPLEGASFTPNQWCLYTGTYHLAKGSYWWLVKLKSSDVHLVGLKLSNTGTEKDYEVKSIRISFGDDVFTNLRYSSEFFKYFEGLSKDDIKHNRVKTYKFPYIPIKSKQIRFELDIYPGSYYKKKVCLKLELLHSTCMENVNACEFKNIHQCSENCQRHNTTGFTCSCYKNGYSVGMEGDTCRLSRVCPLGWEHSTVDNQCYRLNEHKPLKWSEYLQYCNGKILSSVKNTLYEGFPINMIDRNYYAQEKQQMWFIGMMQSNNISVWYDQTPVDTSLSKTTKDKNIGVFYKDGITTVESKGNRGFYICSRPIGTNGKCPAAWRKSKISMCYYTSSRLKLFTFDESRLQCSKMGAILAVFHEEANLVSLETDGAAMKQSFSTVYDSSVQRTCLPNKLYWTEMIKGIPYHYFGWQGMHSYKNSTDTAYFYCQDNSTAASGRDIKIYSEKKTFYQAEAECEKKNGYLFISSDVTEVAHVKQLIQTNGSIYRYWAVGAIDTRSLNMFNIGVDGRDLLTDVWVMGQEEAGRDCLYIDRQQSSAFVKLSCLTETSYICRENNGESNEKLLLSSFQSITERQVETSPFKNTTSLSYYGFGVSRVLRYYQSLNPDEIGNVYNNPWIPDISDSSVPVFVRVQFFSEVKINGIILEGQCDKLHYVLICVGAFDYHYYNHTTGSNNKITSRLNKTVTRDVFYLDYPMYCYQIQMVWSKNSTCETFALDYIGTMGHTLSRTDMLDECAVKETNPCDHVCIDTIGSFYCSCNEGFKLAVDGTTCVLILDTYCHHWKKHGPNCYKFMQNKKDFTSAENYCLSVGGSLASVMSPVEQSYLQDQVEKMGNCDTWLIGLRGTKTSGFTWTDRSRITFLHFADSVTVKEDYVVVLDKGLGWRWNYINSNTCFICKYAFRDCDKSLLSSRVNFIQKITTAGVKSMTYMDGIHLNFNTTREEAGEPIVEIILKEKMLLTAIRCSSDVVFQIQYLAENGYEIFLKSSEDGLKKFTWTFDCSSTTQPTIIPLPDPLKTKVIKLIQTKRSKFYKDYKLEMLVDILGCPIRKMLDYSPYAFCGNDGNSGKYNIGYNDVSTLSYVCDSDDKICPYDAVECPNQIQFWGSSSKCVDFIIKKGSYLDCFDSKYCSKFPCWFGGTCRENRTSYTCECIPPYHGHNCSEADFGLELKAIGGFNDYLNFLVILRSKPSGVNYYSNLNGSQVLTQFTPNTKWTIEKLNEVKVANATSVKFVCPFTGYFKSAAGKRLEVLGKRGIFADKEVLNFKMDDQNSPNCISSMKFVNLSLYTLTPYFISTPTYDFKVDYNKSLCIDLKILKENWVFFKSKKEVNDFCLLDDDLAPEHSYGSSSVKPITYFKKFVTFKSEDIGIFKVCVKFEATYQSGRTIKDMCGVFYVRSSIRLEPVILPNASSINWPASKVLVLNASQSFDPKHKTHSMINKTWSCKILPSMTVCPFMDQIIGDNVNVLTSSVIQVPGGYLEVGKKYRFTVVVRKAGFADESKDVTVIPTVPNEPHYTISCLYGCNKTKLDSTDIYRSTAKCQNCISRGKIVRTIWTVIGYTLGKLNNQQVSTILFFKATDHRLYINPNTLKLGEFYIFNLTATDEDGNIGNTAVTVRVNKAPTPGSCYFTPSKGFALTTKFKLTCSNFVDTDQPLIYSLSKQQHAGIPSTVIKRGATNILTDVTLPRGNATNENYADFTVTVTDTYNLGVSINITVQVSPVSDDDSTVKFLLNKIQTLESTEHNKTAHKNSEIHQMKASIVIMLNEELKDGDATEKAKIREILLKEVKTSDVDTIDEVEIESNYVNLLLEKDEEITELGVDFATDSFQHLSSSLKDLGKGSVTKSKGIASSLLKGTSKLMAGSIVRGKKYLSVIENVTTTDNSTTNFTNTKQVEKERSGTNSFIRIYETISDAMFSLIEPDDPPIVVATPKLSLIVGRISGALGNFTQEVGTSGVFTVPDVAGHSNDSSPEDIPVGYQIGEFKENPFIWSTTAKDIDAPVVSILLKNSNGSELKFENLSTPFDINVYTAKKPSFGNKAYEISLKIAYSIDKKDVINSDSQLIVIPANTNNTIIVMIKPLNTDLSVQIFPHFKRQNVSAEDIQEKGYIIPVDASSLKTYKNLKQDPYLLFINNVSSVKEFYIGIAGKYGEIVSMENIGKSGFDGEISITVHVEVFSSQCAFWDVQKEIWSDEGCELTVFSTVENLHCLCDHLTAFSGAMFVVPNLLHPISDAFLFLTFFENPVVMMTVIIIWMLYFFLLIWTRAEDKKDWSKRGVTVLEDNDPEDKYIYLIGVTTGWWRGASTTADVFIYIRTRYSLSSRHALLDSDRTLFTSGSEDWFLMTTPSRIGRLKSVVIWHNNSGASPSWYLKEIIIKDVQTAETWHCLYDNWLSVELGPKELKAEIPALLQEQIYKKRAYQFALKSSQNFRNDHLWISIFSKSVISNFSRCQRLTCGLSLLLTCMLTNLMFLGVPSLENPIAQYEGDIIEFNWTDIVIGIQSALIMFPVNLIIVQLFIRLSPRPREIRLKNDYLKESDKCKDSKKTDFKLPWWFMYISWTITLLTCFICSYFIMLYGLKYGYAKSVAWLIGFFTSFIQSAFITQPAKVILIAALTTLILKRPASYQPPIPDEDIDENEEYLHDEILKRQTMWQQTHTARERFYVPPMSKTRIQSIRERLKLESYMRDSWREIFMYSVFVVIVVLTVYGHRNVNNCFLFNEVNKNVFIEANYAPQFPFMKIKNVENFWNYTQTTLANNLRVGEDRTTRDNVSYVLGKARLRQIRQQKGTCDLPYLPLGGLEHIDCSGSYWIGDDQTGYFNKTWKKELTQPLNNTFITEWDHQTSFDLRTIPYVGDYATYPGGGYVIELPVNESDVVSRLQEVQNTDWIDDRTRAIFIEFTVYNPNNNLFSVMILLVEFTNYGGVFPYFQIFTSTLYHYEKDFEIFVAMCEATFVLFILAFTYYEIKKFARDTKVYFQDAWSYVEVAIITLSYAAIGIFAQRIISVSSALENYKASRDENFTSFYTCISWDFILQYILACLVSFIIFKFFKLLNFNKNMSSLSATFQKGRPMLAGFFLMITVASMSFAHFAYLVFGSQLRGYSDMGKTIMTLFNFVLGVSDYFGLTVVNPILGPLFFFVFSLFFQYILVTMFLIIVYRSFNSVRRERKGKRDEIHMIRFLINRIRLLVEENH